MAGRYDEWAVARTPSLMRFAAALADDRADGPAVADRAVHRALDRLHGRWDPVATRDDPDLVARAHVVRVCAAGGRGQAVRRRAAALLRTLENRSDAEIADVLGCSESAARAHIVRGVAVVPPETAAPTTEAPVARVQLLARRRPVVVASRTRRGGGAWIAVLAVVALVGGIAWVDHATSTPAGVITYPHVDAPSDWRAESYAGVELRVPDTWGLGASPVRSDSFGGRRHLGGCGSNVAAVLSSADDATYASSVTPFAGRPVVLTERCAPWGSDGVMPTADAVWFDSPLAVGVRSVGAVVAETRALGEQHVTVFANDAALRRRILGTVQAVEVDANGCPTHAVQQPTRGPAELRPSSMSVCVYSEDPGVPVLMWSGHVTEGGASDYAEALAQAGQAGRTCPETPHGRWAALGLHGDTGTRWDLVDPACGALVGADGSRALTAATVHDWALDGVTAYLPMPSGLPSSAAGYFRPVG